MDEARIETFYSAMHSDKGYTSTFRLAKVQIIVELLQIIGAFLGVFYNPFNFRAFFNGNSMDFSKP